MQNEMMSNPNRSSSDFLGLDKKPKKKKAQTPGLIQQQQMMQGQEGVLAGKAMEQGSIGSMDQGTGTENIIKKRRRV